ncbi:MAG: hypothetical protein AABW73_02480 [Nanoarchaeota archaeon]
MTNHTPKPHHVTIARDREYRTAVVVGKINGDLKEPQSYFLREGMEVAHNESSKKVFGRKVHHHNLEAISLDPIMVINLSFTEELRVACLLMSTMSRNTTVEDLLGLADDLSIVPETRTNTYYNPKHGKMLTDHAMSLSFDYDKILEVSKMMNIPLEIVFGAVSYNNFIKSNGREEQSYVEVFKKFGIEFR